MNAFNSSGKVSPIDSEVGVVVRGSGLRARGSVLGGLVLALVVLTGCAGPYQYYEGTGVHDATAAEVAGAWENIEGTRVVLRKDGTAQVEALDEPDFAFEDGWRLSGTGTWKLTDEEGGQRVRLELTKRTKVTSRPPSTSPSPSAVPVTPTPTVDSLSVDLWRFHVGRDERDELELFFFVGDPDIGNMYVMSREVESSPKAP
ncbi:hypothetical protein [Streptomyces sp. Root431]|uniref:hypothetical protein n=1 Tax=Streptomyces sp. Root431 TaxID=1736535 RepID=UPI000B12C392|nr:hypothetical protein [Streptomyces sp. Root431]